MDEPANTAGPTADSEPLTGIARGRANLRPAWTRETRPDPVGGGRPPSPERQLKRLMRKGGAKDVALALFAIAKDKEHPLCVQAGKYIFDRIDGPMERAIKHTLSIPSVSINVQVTSGQRALPELPSQSPRTIDVVSKPAELPVNKDEQPESVVAINTIVGLMLGCLWLSPVAVTYWLIYS